MDEREIFRRYSLALSLLPDETVAADLFMRSRSEAELRKAAERWCARQGLSAPAADGPLPQLDANQQALALHLARRAQRRRQSRVLLGVLFGALLLLGAYTLPPLLTAAPEGMAADPIYAGEPLFQTQVGDAHRFKVYRAEAVPGAVTVWWELRGPRAAEMDRTIRQDLILSYAEHADFETMAHRKDRLLGRSVFAIMNTLETTELTLCVADDCPTLPIRLTMLERDPEARTVSIGLELLLPGYPVTVKRVRIGQRATTLTLSFPDPAGVRFPEVYADGKLLTRSGVWAPSRRGLEYELILHPVPPGTNQLQLIYPLGIVQGTTETIALPAPWLFREWKEEDGLLTAILPMEVPAGQMPWAELRTHDGLWLSARFTPADSSGKLWALESELVSWIYTGGPQYDQVKISAADLSVIHLYMPWPIPDPSLTIDLR